MTEEEKYSILNDLSIQKTILENTFAQENLDEYDEELLEQYQEELDIYKRTIDYINKQADEIEKLKKENEELNKQYDQLTQYFVKNHVAKDKIREIIEKLENEEKALRKDFEKHRVQLFELYKKVVLIEGYKKLLEEEK